MLVHGLCCDHSYFTPQFEYFSNKHRVVAIDLRGHGQSDKPQQSYTMEAFADDVVWLCGQLGLVRPVVIGHSMGSVIAFDLAARYPALFSGIAMLDAAVVPPAGAHAAISHFLGELRSPDYKKVLREYVANVLFIPTDDQRRKERILDDMSSVPRHVMVSAMEGLRDYDAAAAAPGGLTVPALYIAANEPQPRADMPRLLELCPRLLIGKTVGSGHFCQLEVPEQVNAMIDHFLAIALSS